MTETAQHELVLNRLIDAPPEAVYRAWTDPDLLKQWFTPKPYETIHAEMDLRAGGSSLVVMRAPDGTEIPCPGVYLEVVPNKKLVFTDAYTSAWIPSGKPFMTAEITFTDEGGKTRYIARARHWSAEDKAAHEKMGFHEGWGKAADQLAELVKRL